MKLNNLVLHLIVCTISVSQSMSMDESSKPLPDEISVPTTQSAPVTTAQIVTAQPSNGPTTPVEDYDYDEDEDDNDEQEEVIFTTQDNKPLSEQSVTHIQYQPAPQSEPSVNYEPLLQTQTTVLKDIHTELKEIKNALNELIEFKRPVLP